MIVKDEAPIIRRCLDSVKHLIDYWIIVDTGSRDGTQEVISDYMKDMFSAMLKTEAKAIICHVCSIWYMQLTFDIAAQRADAVVEQIHYFHRFRPPEGFLDFLLFHGVQGFPVLAAQGF